MEIRIAERKHKDIVVKLIANAFSNDPQILSYSSGKRNRIELIAKLAFEHALNSQLIFITDDLNAVAICYPCNNNSMNLRMLIENLKFPFVFGISSLFKMLKIEKEIIKRRQKPTSGLYLWLLAANPGNKGQGLGTLLLNYISELNNYHQLILETSNELNLSFYEKRGFKKYDTLPANTDLCIYFLRKN